MSGGSRDADADTLAGHARERASESIHHAATVGVAQQTTPCRAYRGDDELCA